MTVPLSRSVEDYLKAIWQLAKAGDAATSEIAARLDVAPPSVTGMIKRLAEAGHVEYEPYRGVRLTRQGRAAALAVIRRHRIIETYLIMKLGYDWSNVHEEAERLEHAVSGELVERMSFALGHPRYDPHGAPSRRRTGRSRRSRACRSTRSKWERAWPCGRWVTTTRSACATSSPSGWCR
jgi:DtxR family Mn-dependent transcriptional regulator